MKDESNVSQLACVASDLRLRAKQSDAVEGKPFPLAELWLRLRAGAWRLRDAFSEDGRWYALVVEASPDLGGSHRRCGSGLAMLEEALLGQASKVVAIDRKLSPSAVAYAMRSGLDSIGLRCRLRGVPQILMLSARLSHRPGVEGVAARFARLTGAHAQTYVISTCCPKLDLLDPLSAAERAVMLHVLDGCDYREIARARKTSLRTVANQVTTSFRKLGLSGRGELVDQMLQRSIVTHENRTDRRVRPARSAQVAVAVAVAASSVG